MVVVVQHPLVGGHDQVLEMGERKDEVKNSRGWEEAEGDAEGFEDGRESMEWDERGRRLGGGNLMIGHVQVCDTREACEPAARSRIRCGDGPNAINRQGVGVVRRRG